MFELDVALEGGDFDIEKFKEQFEGEYTVSYSTDYAVHVEFGTSSHIIRPRDKKVLHFHKTKGRTQHTHTGGHSAKIGADATFAKEVRHPGTQPQPFLRPAVEEARVRLPEFLKKGWDLKQITEFIFLRSQDIIVQNNTIDKGKLLQSGAFERVA